MITTDGTVPSEQTLDPNRGYQPSEKPPKVHEAA